MRLGLLVIGALATFSLSVHAEYGEQSANPCGPIRPDQTTYALPYYPAQYPTSAQPQNQSAATGSNFVPTQVNISEGKLTSAKAHAPETPKAESEAPAN